MPSSTTTTRPASPKLPAHEAGLERLARLGRARRHDHHPLPAARPSALIGHGQAQLRHGGHAGVHVGHGHGPRGGDARGRHDLLREGLAPLQPGGGGARAEGADAGGAQRVAHPGHQRGLGADHHQIHPEGARQCHHSAHVRPGRRGSPRRPRPMPALPPAQKIRGRSGDRPNARTRACSRPPPPTTSTVRLTPALSHTPRSAEPSPIGPASMPRDGAVLPTAAVARGARGPSGDARGGARPAARRAATRSARRATSCGRSTPTSRPPASGTALSPREPPVTDYAERREHDELRWVKWFVIGGAAFATAVVAVDPLRGVARGPRDHRDLGARALRPALHLSVRKESFRK